MRFLPVPGLPEFAGTIGLSFLEVEEHYVKVSISDDWLAFTRLTFAPYQCLRLTTEDCFLWPTELECHRTVVELADSPWIQQLRASLHTNDPYADFMDKAHHFLIPSRHSIVEVVAWELTWETVPGGATPKGR